MGLFSKKTDNSVLPEEVNQYYLSQRRERTGIMFILAVLALVVTLLVGLALFFGGKFIYNAFRDDKPESTVQTDKGANIDNLGQLEIRGVDNGASTGGDQDVSASNKSANPSTDTQPQNNTPATGDNLSPSQTPALGDGDTEQPAVLPATGDEGH